MLDANPVYTTESERGDLLADVRELYSRLPETRALDACELAWPLFALGYTDGLGDEAEIAAAIQVARGDADPDGEAVAA
jgi:hypothetical protein